MEIIPYLCPNCIYSDAPNDCPCSVCRETNEYYMPKPEKETLSMKLPTKLLNLIDKIELQYLRGFGKPEGKVTVKKVWVSLKELDSPFIFCNSTESEGLVEATLTIKEVL